MTEADLRGQADPSAFFGKILDRMIRDVFSDHASGAAEAEDAALPVLVVLEKGAVREALARCAEERGLKVFWAGPEDSYNYMLDVIINEGVELVISDAAGIRGILKHSAELAVKAVIVQDRFVPPPLSSSIVKAWGCDVYFHYTRPELAGLGAFGKIAPAGKADGGLAVCDELRIDIIDPETGNELPPGRWGEIVVTGILPAAGPVTAYRTGDVSRLIGEADRQQIIDVTKKRAAI